MSKAKIKIPTCYNGQIYTRILYCLIQVHILDAIKQILPFLAFVSFLILDDYTQLVMDAVFLGFRTCLERSNGKAQGTPAPAANRLGGFSVASYRLHKVFWAQRRYLRRATHLFCLYAVGHSQKAIC